jgi:hypothetical protein
VIENTKAEVVPNLGSLFCKTKLYRDLMHQTKFVFVGRKGSGKTQTISQYWEENKLNYKGSIVIDANYISIEYLLDRLHQDDKEINIASYNTKMFNIGNINIRGAVHDIESIFSYEELLRYTWRGYIYLFAIYRIAREYKLGVITGQQAKNFRKAYHFIDQLLNKIPKATRWHEVHQNSVATALYQFAFDKSIAFYDHIVESARINDYAQLNCDMKLANNVEHYLEFMLGKKIKDSFIITIAACTRKLFISLDGFDNLQAEKKGDRIKTSASYDKVFIDKFESTWITTLIDTIYQIKIAPSGRCPLTGKIDICLMIPFDRYMQISSYKRDGFVYRELMEAAMYRGIDLYEMFIKRLWSVFHETDLPKISDANRNNIINELFNVFPNLAREIPVMLKNGNKVNFPLFLYLLRYTFWRPRDIIDYVREVFKTLLYQEKFNMQINWESIKWSVNLCSPKIVIKIIEEFKEFWLNIDICLNKFLFQSSIMSYSEFESFIREKSFSIELSSGDKYSNARDIVKFLYEIGVIGLFLSRKNQIIVHTSLKQHQVFYSGRKPLANIADDSFAENCIFISPVFYSKYNMQIYTDEVLGIHDWETLTTIDSKIDYDYINNPV